MQSLVRAKWAQFNHITQGHLPHFAFKISLKIAFLIIKGGNLQGDLKGKVRQIHSNHARFARTDHKVGSAYFLEGWVNIKDLLPPLIESLILK